MSFVAVKKYLFDLDLLPTPEGGGRQGRAGQLREISSAWARGCASCAEKQKRGGVGYASY